MRISDWSSDVCSSDLKRRILPSPVQAHHRHDTPCLQEEVPHSRVRALLTEAGKRKNGARCTSRRVAGPGWNELGSERTFPKRRRLTGALNGLLPGHRHAAFPASCAGEESAYTSRLRRAWGGSACATVSPAWRSD